MRGVQPAKFRKNRDITEKAGGIRVPMLTTCEDWSVQVLTSSPSPANQSNTDATLLSVRRVALLRA